MPRGNRSAGVVRGPCPVAGRRSPAGSHLADRIAILHQGRIIANGTLAELKQLLPPAKVEYVEKQPTLEDIFLAITGNAGTGTVFGGAIHTGSERYVTYLLTWIAVIAGLTAKSAEGAGAFSYPLIFLPFISSAFVPTRTMPGPVRAFANNQPVTSIVNTIHDLFTQHPVSSSIWTALAWCVGILIVAYALAIATYRRKIVQG